MCEKSQLGRCSSLHLLWWSSTETKQGFSRLMGAQMWPKGAGGGDKKVQRVAGVQIPLDAGRCTTPVYHVVLGVCVCVCTLSLETHDYQLGSHTPATPEKLTQRSTEILHLTATHIFTFTLHQVQHKLREMCQLVLDFIVFKDYDTYWS